MVIALRYVSTPMEAISVCVIPATSWSRMGRLALVSLDVERYVDPDVCVMCCVLYVCV